MIWLLPATLIALAVAIPVIEHRTEPLDPWFEERRQARDERVRALHRDAPRAWWMPVVGWIVVLGFCVALPFIVVIGAVMKGAEWGIAPAHTLAAIAGAVAIVEYAVLFSVPRHEVKYFNRLRRDREGYTQDDFTAHFKRLGGRPEVALEVREYLQVRWCAIPDFPVLPSDSLAKVYRMDVGDELEDMLKDCLCRDLTRDDWASIEQLETVEDLVRVVDRFYIGQRPAAS